MDSNEAANKDKHRNDRTIPEFCSGILAGDNEEAEDVSVEGVSGLDRGIERGASKKHNIRNNRVILPVGGLLSFTGPSKVY